MMTGSCDGSCCEWAMTEAVDEFVAVVDEAVKKGVNGLVVKLDLISRSGVG
jgi:hypothetical protein